MGWCSGTDIFDPVAKAVLESSQPDDGKRVILKALITALWHHDWDCESDSEYWEHPLVQEIYNEAWGFTE